MTTAPTIHFAGIDVQIGPLLRQRCAWCGHQLADWNLDRVAVWPADQNPRPATWAPGTLVLVDGGMQARVPHEDGQPLPDGTCHDAGV